MTLYNHYTASNILDQRGHWDAATRRVILDRVHNIPEFKHFSGHSRATLEALCQRVMPQEHKPPERRIPMAPWIDQNCSHHSFEGFRFDNMPENAIAWDWGLMGLDETVDALFDNTFVALQDAQKDQVLETIRAGNPPGQVWQRMPARRWWLYVALRQIPGVYYAYLTSKS